MARDDSAWLIDAEAHLTAGRLEQAELGCLARLESAPDNPLALSMLSFVRMKQQRWAEAEALLRGACALHPKNTSLHATLASLFLRLGKFPEAVGPLQACVLLDPAVHEHRTKLVAVYQTQSFAAFSEDAKRAMLACLADDGLNHALMSKAWLSLLRLDPQSVDVLNLFASPDYESFRARATADVVLAWQDNDFLNGGLHRFVVADPEIEKGLTFARRWFLEQDLAGRRAATDQFLPLLCTIARTCFLTEYVFATVEVYASLRENVATPMDAALLGCYEPLFAHPDTRRLTTLSDDPCYRDLVRIQIHEPLKEIKIKATISVLAPIADGVSVAVRAQYEENPYPRWATLGRTAVPAVVAAEAKGKHIMIAGCGTGREAVDAALIFPAARVDALDLSRTSLAYGIRKSREIGAKNLFFLQGDILDLGRLKKQFDLIVSSGVLHHMDDPLAGWQACLDVLRPLGVLKIAVYSRLARTQISEARAWVEREGFPATIQGIRAFRAAVMTRPTDDPVREHLIAWDDFYSVSACRDLAFHVREHTFTLPQLADIASDFGLSVMQVDTKNTAHQIAYRARFPGDPAAIDLLNWHAFEQEQPSLFAGMYSIWFCRTAEIEAVDVGWIKQTHRM